MSYLIRCNSENCKKKTWASNIVALVNEHTEKNGRIKCTTCGKINASIYVESKLQEREIWKRYIKGIITLKTEYETYTPYALLVSSTEDGEISEIHLQYFKDMRNTGGKLKHGHGPGGGPALNKKDFFQLLDKLIDFGYINIKNISDFIAKKNDNSRKI